MFSTKSARILTGIKLSQAPVVKIEPQFTVNGQKRSANGDIFLTQVF